MSTRAVSANQHVLVDFVDSPLANANGRAQDADAAYLRRRDAPSTTGVAQIDIVDLFSGCGGLTYGAIEGARRAARGARMVLAVDNDPNALAVLQATLRLEDERVAVADLGQVLRSLYESVQADEQALFEHALGSELLLAGPPCQGHSSLNNHTRHDDDRNDLYLAVARVARIIRPRVVIIENVGSVGSDRRGAMTSCAATLKELGFEVVSRRIDLHRIGVPQTRIRHVLVAAKERRFEWKLPEILGRTISWAIDDLLPLEGSSTFDTPSRATAKNLERIQWLFANDAFDLPNELRPECHHGNHSYRSMYGRLRWDAPAQTVTSGFGSMGQGRYVHPLRPRTLTPHEAARLQFLPDFVRFDKLDRRGPLATAIGNVAPPRLTVVLVQALIEQGLL